MSQCARLNIKDLVHNEPCSSVKPVLDSPPIYGQSQEQIAHDPEMEEDPFDSLLNLEEKFYDDGYQLGVADGSRAGRIEGRAFGLEKAFEKFLPMGVLHGRSTVWAGRLPNHQGQRHRPDEANTKEQPRQSIEPEHEVSNTGDQSIPQTSENEQILAADSSPESRLPTLPDNPRLEKHIQTLYALVEAASLSTENTEEAVSDFDDRFKRATAKAKIIERLIGEVNHRSNQGSVSDAQLDGHQREKKQENKSGGDGSIEDISSL